MDRNVSFSIKPEDVEAQENVLKLKQYAKDRGISFSFFMCKAIAKLNKELKIK